jgi:hypothetical protein
MKTRDERITEEAAALWRAVFGEPPPARADGSELLGMITGSLPEVAYDRMTSPFLRASQISRPKRRGEGGRL